MSSDDEAEAAGDTHLLGFSDEILLHILSHVPSTDLVLNVRRSCRKLAALCLDKSLVHTVLLQKDYQVRPGGQEGKAKQAPASGGQCQALLLAQKPAAGNGLQDTLSDSQGGKG